jgi:hypothetical protein
MLLLRLRFEGSSAFAKQLHAVAMPCMVLFRKFRIEFSFEFCFQFRFPKGEFQTELIDWLRQSQELEI